MAHRSERRILRHRLAAIAFGLGLGGIAALGLAAGFGVAPGGLLARIAGLRPTAEVRAIHQLDGVLGYGLRPGSSFRHRAESFDAEYHVDALGSRRVPGFAAGRPRVLVLGDSWTFGHGVDDDETYAARLQAHWPELGLRNLGVMGYGTPHALLALQRALAQHGEVVLVLYGWTPIHLQRSYLRASHLRAAPGGRTPRLEIEDGRLVSKGLADTSVAIADDVPGLVVAEWSRTVAGVKRMAELASEYGARFVVVLLPGPESNRAFDDNSRRMGTKLGTSVERIDLQADPRFPKSDDLFFPNDGHPNARWHQRVADAIVARLDPPVSHR